MAAKLPFSGSLRLPNTGSGTLNPALGASLGRKSLKRLTVLRTLYISMADLPSLSIKTAVSKVLIGYNAFELAHSTRRE
jgi:hypothetical protein